MGKKKMRTIVILLAMAGGLVLSPPMAAQNDGSRGQFGRGGNNGYANRSEVGASGLLNQGFGATAGNLTNQGFGATAGNLFNQGFGATNGGITNQTFGATPMGSGLLILLAAGAGYATLKKRKSNR